MRFRLDLRTGEMIIAIGLAMIGGAMVWGGGRMPAGSLAVPGPGFFPAILGVLLVLASLGVLITALRRSDNRVHVTLGNGDVLAVVLALAIVPPLFETLGAPLLFAVFLTGLLWRLAGLRWWVAVAGGLGGSAVAWGVFSYLLGVQLPAGILAGL